MPRSAGVDRPREQLLAGPRLTDDQRARAAVRQESDGPVQLLLDDLALAHDSGEGARVPVRGGGAARPAAVERGDRVPEHLEIVR